MIEARNFLLFYWQNMMSPATLIVQEMEVADGRLRRSGLLNSVDAVHTVVSACVTHRKCCRVFDFVRVPTLLATCYSWRGLRFLLWQLGGAGVILFSRVQRLNEFVWRVCVRSGNTGRLILSPSFLLGNLEAKV